ncbi:MAG: phage tail tube protein [Oceanibaculum nanhaiense]|jgi:hypothetical protein|uniref:phage tail tube protein n=1 Tax=Oceanibaculum nanhaiense TaxID=1909734 RepID=UPI0032EC20AD
MAGQESQNTKFYYEDPNTPDTWIKLVGIVGIDGPSGSGQEIDVSDLDSVAREFLQGLPDEGNVTLDMNYIPGTASQEFLRTARAERSKQVFRIGFNTDPEEGQEFEGYVVEFSHSAAVDSALKASVTIRITGAVEDYVVTP